MNHSAIVSTEKTKPVSKTRKNSAISQNLIHSFQAPSLDEQIVDISIKQANKKNNIAFKSINSM